MMSGITSPDAAVYVDVATQTPPFTSPPPISPVCPASPITSFLTATSLPAPVHSRSSIRNRDPRGETSSNEQFMPSEKPSGSDIALPRLPSLPSSFGPHRQTGMRTTNTRAVSLPETLLDENLHLVLSQLVESTVSENTQQSRAVSMPAVPWKTEQINSPEASDYRESTESSLEENTGGEHLAENSSSVISSAPSTPRTVVVHSLPSDLFNTPSPPPSSCDSVEFTLEDPVLLPDSFLRSSVSPPIFVPEKVNNAAPLLEDDGWITWASSPPRPIPALHGPSSLPYARCPSGAEGTIIEEQSSMSRMIWGLDPNDIVSTPQVSHHQQSRAIPIKPPSEMTRRESLHIPPTIKSTPVSLPAPSVGSRYGLGDPRYNNLQEHQILKMYTAPILRPEERPDGVFCGATRESTGLGFIVAEEQASCGVCHEQGFRDGVVDSSRRQMPDSMDSNIQKMLSVGKEAKKQRQMTTQASEEKEGVGSSIVPLEHASDLIDLFSSPVKISAHNSYMNPHIPSASRTNTDPSGYLPTPPSSSSPQWSSMFSPVNSSNFSTAMNFASSGHDPSTNFKMLSKMSEANDQLSHELRRFVFENMSSSNPTDSATSFRAPQITRISSAPAYTIVRSNHSLVKTPGPTHPPGITIPNHLNLSQPSHHSGSPSTRGALSQLLTPSNSTSTYRRSNLSNPRSIPLSRLRQNQKRDAVKLATVPEEDLDAPAHEKWFGSPSHHLSHSALRTPSPLADQLQPQSVEEKDVIGEEAPMAGPTVRVKLPYNLEFRAGDGERDLGSKQGTTPQGSPKKKRPQRKKKSTISRSTENGKGFPLVSEGTVSFGS